MCLCWWFYLVVLFVLTQLVLFQVMLDVTPTLGDSLSPGEL